MKKIYTQAAFERTLNEETIVYIERDESNKRVIKEISLDGDFLEVEAIDENGSEYLVFYKVGEEEKPFLVTNMHTHENMTNQVEVCHQRTIADNYRKNACQREDA